MSGGSAFPWIFVGLAPHTPLYLIQLVSGSCKRDEVIKGRSKRDEFVMASSSNLYTCLTCSLNPSRITTRHYSPHSVLLPHTPPYNTLVFQAAKLLGPPAIFDASKLQVVFKGEETDRIIPRTYNLSHCDFTANLTLTVSSVIELHQLKGWYNKDDVVAQWAQVKGHVCLDVHCHVSGPNSLLDLAAEFRYYIFSKELPLVLEAVLHGDAVLFEEHKELMDAFVRVFFHSSCKKYNRVECWGPLKDAAKGRVGGEQSVPPKNKSWEWGMPKSLFTFLL